MKIADIYPLYLSGQPFSTRNSPSNLLFVCVLVIFIIIIIIEYTTNYHLHHHHHHHHHYGLTFNQVILGHAREGHLRVQKWWISPEN